MTKKMRIRTAQPSMFCDGGGVLRTQSASSFVREAMKRYGEEVILNRSLPRIEDGLRPVQRLLFWSCMDLAKSRFIKSAKIAGHCIASYSPHGEKAAYDSLVRMVRERYPLAEGQGNFGSATTSAASARYTESRIHPFGLKMVAELDDFSVIPYEKNYDDTLDQPKFLPCVVPNILLNPSSGVAVAITSKIAGFNLAEVISALRVYLSTQDVNLALREFHGPDVGKCTVLSSEEEVRAVIETGDGCIEYECAYSLEERRGKKMLVISGYAPEFSIGGFLSKCEALQDLGIVEAIRNETSESNGDRIVVEYVNEDAYDKLIKLVRKKVSYKFNVLVEENGGLAPRMLGVGGIIERWLEIRRDLVKKTIERNIAEMRTHIHRESTKLRAISDRKALLRAIESDLPFDAALKNEVGLESEDAAIVAKMPLDSLRKANVDKVRAQIKTLIDRCDAMGTDLTRIDEVILGQLGSFFDWVSKELPHMVARQTVLAYYVRP
jgi:DNA gyrase subunit A